MLTRLVVGSSIVVLTVAVLAGPLALVGMWTPWSAGLALTVGLLLAFRLTSFDLPAPGRPHLLTGSLVLIGGAFTTWAAMTSAENVVVRRDAASYFQTALALSSAQSTPLPVDPVVSSLDLLSIEGLGLASPGFFEVGTGAAVAIEPQFLVGVTSWYSIGYWLAGADGAWVLAAAIGGLAVMAVGVLLSFLLPPVETIVATAGTALALPILHVARSTYSEQYGLLMLGCALLVLVLALHQRVDAQAARLAVLAGVLLGGTTMFRIDSLREAALFLPVAAWLTIRRESVGRPALRGVGVGLVLGILYWLLISPHYLGVNLQSVRLALLLLVASAALSLSCIVAAAKGWAVPPAMRRRLPLAAAGAVAACFIVLLSRPLWWVARGRNEGARLGQEREGLPLDLTRLYYENSIEWTAWWLGWPTVILAMVAAVYLMHRAVVAVLDTDSRPAPWVGPFLVGLGSAILVWVRPGINPDHPWADRRLVLLLPVIIALATWLVGAVSRRARTRGVRVAGLAAGALLIVVPPILATLPFATERIGEGTYAAVDEGCDFFEPEDVVLAVDGLSSFYWPQTIRGMCQVPVVKPDTGLFLTAGADETVRDITQAMSDRLAGSGRTLVIISTDPEALRKVGGEQFATPRKIIDVRTTMDDSTVTVRPSASQPVRWTMWASRASDTGAAQDG